MFLHFLNFRQTAQSFRNPGFLMQFVGKMTLQSASLRNIFILWVLVHKGFGGHQGSGETKFIFVLNGNHGSFIEQLLKRLVAWLVSGRSSAPLLGPKKRQFCEKFAACSIKTFRRVQLFCELFQPLAREGRTLKPLAQGNSRTTGPGMSSSAVMDRHQHRILVRVYNAIARIADKIN